MRSRVRSSTCLTLLVIAGAMSATDARAQTLRGTVRDSASGVPIPGAVVTLLDSAAGVAARSTTDGGGQFRAVLVGNGVRAVRVVRLGFRPRTVTLPAARDDVIQVDVPMTLIPISMQSVNVTAGARLVLVGLVGSARGLLARSSCCGRESPAPTEVARPRNAGCPRLSTVGDGSRPHWRT